MRIAVSIRFFIYCNGGVGDVVSDGGSVDGRVVDVTSCVANDHDAEAAPAKNHPT